MNINQYLSSTRSFALREMMISKNISLNMQSSFTEQATRNNLQAKSFKDRAVQSLAIGVLHAMEVGNTAVKTYYKNRADEYNKVLTSSKVALKSAEYVKVYMAGLDTKLTGNTLEELTAARINNTVASGVITENIKASFEEEQKKLKEDYKIIEAKPAVTDREKELKETEKQLISDKIFTEMERVALFDDHLPLFLETHEENLKKSFNSISQQIEQNNRYREIWASPGTVGEKINKFYEVSKQSVNKSYGSNILFGILASDKAGSIKQMMGYLGTLDAENYSRIEGLSEETVAWLKNSYRLLKDNPKKKEELLSIIKKEKQLTETESAIVTGKEVRSVTEARELIKTLEEAVDADEVRDSEIKELEKQKEDLNSRISEKESSYKLGDRISFLLPGGEDSAEQQKQKQEDDRKTATGELEKVNEKLENLKKEKEAGAEEAGKRLEKIKELKKAFKDFEFTKIKGVAQNGIVSVGEPTRIIENELGINPVRNLANLTEWQQWAKSWASQKKILNEKGEQISVSPMTETLVYQLLEMVENGQDGDIDRVLTGIEVAFKEEGIGWGMASALLYNLDKTMKQAKDFIDFPVNFSGLTESEREKKRERKEKGESNLILLRSHLHQLAMGFYPQQQKQWREKQDPETGRKASDSWLAELLGPEGMPTMSPSSAESEAYIGRIEDMGVITNKIRKAREKYKSIVKDMGEALQTSADTDRIKLEYYAYKVDNPEINFGDVNNEEFLRIAGVLHQANRALIDGGSYTTVEEALAIIDPTKLLKPTVIESQKLFSEWWGRHVGTSSEDKMKRDVILNFMTKGSLKFVPLPSGQIGILGKLRNGKLVNFDAPDIKENETYEEAMEKRLKELGVDEVTYELYEAYLL